jgi:hypothetical protein
MNMHDGCGIYVVPSLIVPPYLSQIRSARAPILVAYLPDSLRLTIRESVILGALAGGRPVFRFSLLRPCAAWAGSSFSISSVLVMSRGPGLSLSALWLSRESSLQLVPAHDRPGPTGPFRTRLARPAGARLPPGLDVPMGPGLVPG